MSDESFCEVCVFNSRSNLVKICWVPNGSLWVYDEEKFQL